MGRRRFDGPLLACTASCARVAAGNRTSRRTRSHPHSRRHRLDFPDRRFLERAAGRLLDDPLVESCSVNVPGLLVEVGLAAHAVRTQQDVSDWCRRYTTPRSSGTG